MKWFSILVICVSLLSSCQKENADHDQQVITIKSEALKNNLYYSGVIQPLKTLVITSPAEGTIIDTAFQYGEFVQPGQLLFTISSSKFLTDYKSGLMSYVKAKNEYSTAQSQLNESKFLHDNKLIPDDEFKMKKTNYYTARLALMQAKDTLETLLNQLNIKDINLHQLSISDTDKINSALRFSSDSLRILSPVSGMALSQSKGEEEIKKTLKGDVVKQGDVLAIIGDMQGFTVRIKVNELTVNQLKLGQRVAVTGIAFPDEILAGEIKLIDHQGETSSGGIPTFAVEIVVPKLTEKQQHEIHVGMSAKVEIIIAEDAKISVPIQAVKEINGKMFVNLLNQTNRKTLLHEVKTGKTTAENVAILSGLKPGDKIVLN